jgi:hypothetical protein
MIPLRTECVCQRNPSYLQCFQPREPTTLGKTGIYCKIEETRESFRRLPPKLESCISCTMYPLKTQWISQSITSYLSALSNRRNNHFRENRPIGWIEEANVTARRITSQLEFWLSYTFFLLRTEYVCQINTPYLSLFFTRTTILRKTGLQGRIEMTIVSVRKILPNFSLACPTKRYL